MGTSRSLTDEEGSKRGALSFGRHPPPSDLAPVREARPGCVPIRRLARGGRAVVVAGSAARPARRVRLAVPVAVGVRGLPAAPRPARREGHGRRGGGLRGAASILDGQLGALRRRGRTGRPGALRAGVEGTARLCGRARRPPHRRSADLRLRRGRRSRQLAGAVRATARSPARRPTRSVRTASAGGTRSTTGPSTARPAFAGGGSASGGRSSSSTSAASTTSGATSPTGRSRSGMRRPSAGTGGPAPAPGSSTQSSASSATCP